MSLYVLASLVLLLLWTGEGAEGQEASLMAPKWNVGDEWTFSVETPDRKGTFAWSVLRTETVDGTDYYVLGHGADGEAFFRSSDLAWYQDRSGGQVTARATPAQLRYTWPLGVGHEWEQTVTVVRTFGPSPATTVRACRIEAEETVSVPAGTFKTFKTVCRNKTTNEVIHQTWFAPAAKLWVKEWSKFPWGIQERELIGLKLHP
jgi:hypothetical protein